MSDFETVMFWTGALTWAALAAGAAAWTVITIWDAALDARRDHAADVTDWARTERARLEAGDRLTHLDERRQA